MLYASLVGPLNQLYYPLPTDDEGTARRMLNSSRLAKLWCSIYDRAGAEACIARFGGMMLPDSFAQSLDYDGDRCIPTSCAPDPTEAPEQFDTSAE